MSEFEIRVPARKKQMVTGKDNQVVKESTLSMKNIASLLIIEGSKHVVYDKEE